MNIMISPAAHILAIDDEPDNLFAPGTALAPAFNRRIAVRGDRGLGFATAP